MMDIGSSLWLSLVGYGVVGQMQTMCGSSMAYAWFCHSDCTAAPLAPTAPPAQVQQIYYSQTVIKVPQCSASLNLL